MIVGVDNGNSGATCILYPDASIAGFKLVPTHKPYQLEQINVRELLDYARSFGGPIKLGIEEPLRHAPSAQSLRSMALNVGLVCGAAEMCDDIELHRIAVRDWQTALLGKQLKKGETKAAALAAAQKIWPNEKWLDTPKRKIPHSGVIDAALIAFYLLHTTKHHEQS